MPAHESDTAVEALAWVARSLAWERRLRELEEPTAPNLEAATGQPTLRTSDSVFNVRTKDEVPTPSSA